MKTSPHKWKYKVVFEIPCSNISFDAKLVPYSITSQSLKICVQVQGEPRPLHLEQAVRTEDAEVDFCQVSVGPGSLISRGIFGLVDSAFRVPRS